MYVLGIDGGGTKTKGVLADQYGKVYASETVGPTNQNGVEIHLVEKELSRLFASLKLQNSKAFSMLDTVFAGMSGVDRPEARAVMKSIMEKFVPANVKIIIDNDAVNALYAGTLGVPGIVQIAGTGSITFGINANGERQRAGGWGYLIDDEGSGYDIGRAALNAVFKAYDGRGPKTTLTNMLLKHFQVQEVPELIHFIYEPGKSRTAIAPLSQYVSAAADQNDDAAKQIIQQAAGKLAQAIGSLRISLFKDETQPVQVVMAGGVFNREDLFVPFIQSRLQEQSINVQLVKPVMEPAGGAIIAGLSSSSQVIETSFIEKLKLD
ncbi:BadF/BadG/BcrA/BcrD ATPase family protein [Neobacillus muris]|uniref:BadF/BadG/BcrA/BcrD ATPase family protein n=1 Tax=Neobacillus muris TaxID=2941334 RepID=UPI00203A487F|nr:BadF/BadG/BcrA/BcrD ATPase family protein [Neobacillus muris]